MQIKKCVIALNCELSDSFKVHKKSCIVCSLEEEFMSWSSAVSKAFVLVSLTPTVVLWLTKEIM